MPAPSARQLVVFSLAGEEYALPIGAVHEIIRFTEPRAIASEVACIRGVIGLRGRIVPVYDLAVRLGLDGDAAPGKIVIVATPTGQVGVTVGDVEEVLTVDEADLEPVPAATAGAIEAIARVGDRLVILLDAEGLFARAAGEDLAAA